MAVGCWREIQRESESHCCRGTRQQTQFLCNDWFPEHNPAALRVRIMRQLLQLFVEQAPRSSLDEPRRSAALAAVCDLMQQLDRVDRFGQRYDIPVVIAAPAALAEAPADGDRAGAAVAEGAVADATDAGEEAVDERPAQEAEPDAVAANRAVEDSDEDVVEVSLESVLPGGDAVGAVTVASGRPGHAEAAIGAGEEPVEDAALEIESMVMALQGDVRADAGEEAVLEGLDEESEEILALEPWHPDDLWR